MYRMILLILKKIGPYVIILLLMGLLIFIIKCQIVYPIEYVGHADASAYAEMADSLIHGRGFEVDYLSFYFVKSPNIVRPEDHWPPLYSILIAPFFLIFGKTAFSAKLPSIILASFFIPLITFYITKELSKNKIIGLCAGLTILLSPSFFGWSLHCLSDIAFVFVVCAFVLFSIKAIDNEKNFYCAGIFMGLAYYAKGSGILLFPCYVIFYFLFKYGLKKSREGNISFIPHIKSILINKRFLIGLLIGFLILLPWLIRNFIHFGDPLYSTQKFAAGYGGYIDWEIGTYELYWGEKPPPTYKDKFNDGIGHVLKMTLDYLKTNVWWTFVDINSRWGKFGKYAFLTYIVNSPSVIGFFLLWGNKKRHLIWLVVISLLLFLSATWFPIDRMVLPLFPILIALSWTVYYTILKLFFRLISTFIHRLSRIVHYLMSILLICLLLYLAVFSAKSINEAVKNNGYPYRDADQAWMDMGKWLKANVPLNTVTMTRKPWQLHFYSDQPAIQIPRATLDKTIEVMKFYNASYIIPQLDIRPSLESLVKGEKPGFELVYDNQTLQLYRIRYDLMKK